VAEDYVSAVRMGTMAAGRLHRDLGLRRKLEHTGAPVDVFGVIHDLGLPLMLRPLKGLLGAYFRDPTPGILVTTERPMSIQRLTAAHELGHNHLGHKPSLDDESQILRRGPAAHDPANNYQETEADAFAIAFMMPKWLILSHCARQTWHVSDLARPAVAYQLALRLGASYEAACRTLTRYRLISEDTLARLLASPPRALKVDLLGDYRPENYRGDAWLLTERDEGTRIEGSRNDVFVLRLEEHASAGYLWDLDQLTASGFAIVGDTRESDDDQGIGGPVMRQVTAAPQDAPRGQFAVEERRPWETDAATASLAVDFDLSGPERIGYSRAELRRILEAA
jgi:Zn-dependent peptidase ImmA (M78 family)/predicted secreted protein